MPDTDFVHHISTTIKQCCAEPLRRILKPFESKFKPDHLIWIAVASKDLRMAHRLVFEFWEKSHLDVGNSFDRFTERLIYTYKDWGAHPRVFDVFFLVLVEAGLLLEAGKLFDKLLNYGVLVSVDSCNLFLARLSNSFDGIKTGIRVFREYPEVGVCWNTVSYNIILHSLCQLGRVKEAHNLVIQMEFRGNVLDVVSYSIIIDGYCQVEGKVLKLMEELQRKGLKPNQYTYISIISLLCKTGRVVEAGQVLREMKNQRIFPDNVVYTTLISGFGKSGNVSAEYKLFDEMKSKKIVPDFVT
ncbi:hypothetical protein JHK82_050164 [Glycine max]|nr:hypothetical protein JHK82_050164 [Glycine max]